MGEPPRPAGGNEAAVAALVERLVREARLPNRRARDDLRRELESHFADAADAGAHGPADALARFGSVDVAADGFRRAYRPGRRALHVAKLAASIVVASGAALLVQGIGHLRSWAGPDGHGLTAWNGPTAYVSVALVLAAVGARELGIAPLCARLERRPLRLLATFAMLAASVYVTHTLVDGFVHPAQAIVRSASTLAAWTTAVAVVAGVDAAYLRRLGAPM